MGLGVLRLEPRALWSMSISEFEAAVRGHSGIDAFEPTFHRRDLDALLQTFPDGASQ